MTASLQAFVSSGQVVDLVIACIVLEIALLAVWRRRALGAALPALCAGLALALALRSALAGQGWEWLTLWLAAAGLAHGCEVWRRWRR